MLWVQNTVIIVQYFRATQHINFIPPQHAVDGDTKVLKSGCAGKFGGVSVEFPQRTPAWGLAVNLFCGPHFGVSGDVLEEMRMAKVDMGRGDQY